MKKILVAFIGLLLSSMVFAQECNIEDDVWPKNFVVKIFYDEENILNEHFVQILKNNSYIGEIALDPTIDHISLDKDDNGNQTWLKSDVKGLSIKLKTIENKLEVQFYSVNRSDKPEYIILGESKILNYNEKYLIPILYKDKDLFIEVKPLKQIIFN